MKKLKKLLSTLIVVVLMAMVLVPTATAGLAITPRSNGTGGRATTASMTNGQSNNVIAELRVHGGAGGAISHVIETPPMRVSATTAWVNTTFRVSHNGRIFR